LRPGVGCGQGVRRSRHCVGAEEATAEEEKQALESELANEKQRVGTQNSKQMFGFEEEDDTDKRRKFEEPKNVGCTPSV
jgi:hypothetical protein